MACNDDELAGQVNGSVFEAGGAADMSTAEAQRISNAVLRMQPIGETEAHAWIQYWISRDSSDLQHRDTTGMHCV